MEHYRMEIEPGSVGIVGAPPDRERSLGALLNDSLRTPAERAAFWRTMALDADVLSAILDVLGGMPATKVELGDGREAFAMLPRPGGVADIARAMRRETHNDLRRIKLVVRRLVRIRMLQRERFTGGRGGPQRYELRRTWWVILVALADAMALTPEQIGEAGD